MFNDSSSIFCQTFVVLDSSTLPLGTDFWTPNAGAITSWATNIGVVPNWESTANVTTNWNANLGDARGWGTTSGVATLFCADTSSATPSGTTMGVTTGSATIAGMTMASAANIVRTERVHTGIIGLYSDSTPQTHSVVIGLSSQSVPAIWDAELTQGYQELAVALNEMSQVESEDEWSIDQRVYEVACYVAAELKSESLPAPQIFNHGRQSVVFNWSNGGDNLYLTISADRLSALISSPDRIKRRMEFSVRELMSPQLALASIRAAFTQRPVTVKRWIEGATSAPPVQVV
jgi:hypothetical protein